MQGPFTESFLKTCISLSQTTTKHQQLQCLQYIRNSQQETIKHRKNIISNCYCFTLRKQKKKLFKTASYFSLVTLIISISARQEHRQFYKLGSLFKQSYYCQELYLSSSGYPVKFQKNKNFQIEKNGE